MCENNPKKLSIYALLQEIAEDFEKQVTQTEHKVEAEGRQLHASAPEHAQRGSLHEFILRTGRDDLDY